jgi:hypothetical protein
MFRSWRPSETHRNFDSCDYIKALTVIGKRVTRVKRSEVDPASLCLEISFCSSQKQTKVGMKHYHEMA